MIKKWMAGVVLAAAAAAFVPGAASAWETGEVDVQGIKFEIPEDIRDLVTVQEDGLKEDEIVAVYETASVEAAEAMGKEFAGAGWLFTICKVPEEKMKELRCGGMDGMIVFAEDEDIYYVYNHPTDVRYLRADNEEMEKDQDVWTSVNEWASGEVCPRILENNPKLDAEWYTNTDLDMHLAQAAYRPGTKYELRSLEYGADALDPSSLKEDDFIEDLAEDYTYEIQDDVKAPDGEYCVLAFDEDGEEVRFDFFTAQGSRDLIREVRTIGGEEQETFYRAIVKDADEDDTTTDIVEEWCAAIAGGADEDDD